MSYSHETLFFNGTSSSHDYEGMPVLAQPTGSASEDAAIGAPLSALLDALDEAWDVHAADPDAQEMPSISALAEALELLKMLPGGVLAPRPAIEPTGDIAWSWDEHGDFFVLAVSGIGVLEWTAVIDGIEDHGPLPLLDTLQKEQRDILLDNFPSVHA